jgi:hypothetical protein
LVLIITLSPQIIKGFPWISHDIFIKKLQDNNLGENMAEKGRLLYEEEILERRAQGELNTNHIVIFASVLALILTWTVFAEEAIRGVASVWLIGGLVCALIITMISFYLIDRMLRAEFSQFLPIKIYENGMLLPTTIFDRVLWRKKSFIHRNEISIVRLERAHKAENMDRLIAITNTKKRYPKIYDRNSKEVLNILDVVKKNFPNVKIVIEE